jgi:hypothetical protein
MVANTAPIFTVLPNIGLASECTAANTTKDLTAGTIYLCFTAEVTDGSRVEKLVVRPKGTNAVSVMRVFINNGLTTATTANNALFAELTLPVTTVSEVASIIGYEIPMNISLPPSWRIYVTLGSVVAGGYAVAAVGGDY